MAKLVYLRFDDVDKHGAGCECGLCNNQGKSYGVSIYDVTDMRDMLNEAMSSGDEYDMDTLADQCTEDWRREIRVYGCSENAADDAARRYAANQKWEMV